MSSFGDFLAIDGRSYLKEMNASSSTHAEINIFGIGDIAMLEFFEGHGPEIRAVDVPFKFPF